MSLFNFSHTFAITTGCAELIKSSMMVNKLRSHAKPSSPSFNKHLDRGVFGQQFDPLFFERFFKFCDKNSRNDREGVGLVQK